MTSYAELLRTCTEFQDNFTILSGKYGALSQQLANEKDETEQLRRKLEEAARREEQSEEHLRALRRDLEEAGEVRAKLSAATIELEHMKSRLQHASRGVTDTLAEHSQEVEQLKGQIKDLLQRIELAADGTRVEELNKQIVELEGRAATANAALLEEKERFSQQLLVAHSALREQQARNLELEQRYRAMESEVTEMRAAVRRSAELQNDAALLKERHATEASLAQREANSLRQELQQVRAQLASQRERHEEALDSERRSGAHDKAATRSRIATLSASLSAAQAAAETEHHRYTELLRTTQQQIDNARDEEAVELTALRRALTEAKEETRRTQYRCDCLRDELDAACKGQQQLQAAKDALQAQVDASARQLAAGAQQEAWLTAERTHVGEQLAATQRRVEELSTALQQQERVTLDLERSRMRVEMLESEVQETRRAAREAEGRVQDVEEAAAQRLHGLRQQLKACHKHIKLEREANHALRKRLVQAVAEREAQLYGPMPSGERVQPPCGAAAADSRPVSDVIGLLKRQNEDAERLHSRVMELSH